LPVNTIEEALIYIIQQDLMLTRGLENNDLMLAGDVVNGKDKLVEVVTNQRLAENSANIVEVIIDSVNEIIRYVALSENDEWR
jgi:hypothetical protein